MRDVQYLQLLAEQYPSIEAVSNAIVGLNATLRLPKGTEYYFSDLHGEHEAFIHLLRSGSGVIRRKIDDLFGQSMLECDRDELASIIYYPKRNLARKRRRKRRCHQPHLLLVARRGRQPARPVEGGRHILIPRRGIRVVGGERVTYPVNIVRRS